MSYKNYNINERNKFISKYIKINEKEYLKIEYKKTEDNKEEIEDNDIPLDSNYFLVCKSEIDGVMGEDNFWFDDDSIPYPTVNISKALTKKLEGSYNVG